MFGKIRILEFCHSLSRQNIIVAYLGNNIYQIYLILIRIWIYPISISWFLVDILSGIIMFPEKMMENCDTGKAHFNAAILNYGDAPNFMGKFIFFNKVGNNVFFVFLQRIEYFRSAIQIIAWSVANSTVVSRGKTNFSH